MIPKKESDRVEFKPVLNNAVIEALVAFSNAKGGAVYVGVGDNSEIVGVMLGKDTITQFINEIKNKTLPSIIPDTEVIDIEDKKIVILTVMEYPIKPVSVLGKYYRRVNASNHQLTASEVANLHLQTINSSWDFYVDPNHSETDLSKEKIAWFANIIRQSDNIGLTGLSDAEILSKLEILRGGKVTFGAYLLFAKDYCSISDVQVGRFKSDTMIIDSISFNTDLFQEVDGIIAFIKKHLKVEYIITGEPRRIERFDYPLDAIREIVINMIVHRDYRDSSASIIKMYDDRIEFYNPGKLYGGITVEDLLSGNYTSKSRNKLVAKAFKEVELIERYGSGIMRVREICREYGVIEPDFKEVFDGFMVILYNAKTPENELNKNVDTGGDEVGINDSNKVGIKKDDKVGKKADKKVGIKNNCKVGIKNEEKTQKSPENIEIKPYEDWDSSMRVGTNINTKVGKKADKKVGIKSNGKVGIEIDEKVGINGVENEAGNARKVTPNQQIILDKIVKNPHITYNDLSVIVGISKRKIEANMQKLKAKGLIERVGAKKSGYWKVMG